MRGWLQRRGASFEARLRRASQDEGRWSLAILKGLHPEVRSDAKPRRTHNACAVLLFSVLHLTPAHAVQPDEILKDPAQEARARQLSAGLRCLVCQNESIDDSSAPLAKDLRLLVRERIVAGDSDAQVKAFLVARYGEFVLLRPPFSARTAVLYGAPFVALGLGGLLVWRLSRRRGVVAAKALTDEEKARLERVLGRE
jgi:cytochrome c-type biogenesis protein CcmH